jgi:hypothetical protein
MLNKLQLSAWIIPAILISILLSGCAVPEERVYPYPFDTAKIDYKLSGTLEGTQTVHIKDDNATHETHVIRKLPEDMQENMDILIIDKKDQLYEIDLNKKTGIKSINPIYTQLKEKPMEDRLDFLVKLATGKIEGEKPASKGKKQYAGQECDLYDMMEIGEICIWNGIPLYSSLTIPGDEITSSMTAEKIELNIVIPDNTFNIPEDITITDLEAQ